MQIICTRLYGSCKGWHFAVEKGLEIDRLEQKKTTQVCYVERKNFITGLWDRKRVNKRGIIVVVIV